MLRMTGKDGLDICMILVGQGIVEHEHVAGDVDILQPPPMVGRAYAALYYHMYRPNFFSVRRCTVERRL